MGSSNGYKRANLAPVNFYTLLSNVTKIKMSPLKVPLNKLSFILSNGISKSRNHSHKSNSNQGDGDVV